MSKSWGGTKVLFIYSNRNNVVKKGNKPQDVFFNLFYFFPYLSEFNIFFPLPSHVECLLAGNLKAQLIKRFMTFIFISRVAVIKKEHLMLLYMFTCIFIICGLPSNTCWVFFNSFYSELSSVAFVLTYIYRFLCCIT